MWISIVIYCSIILTFRLTSRDKGMSIFAKEWLVVCIDENLSL